MKRKLSCEVITPEKILYRGDVDMVIAPGELGELGILPLHMPLVSTLKMGELRLKHDDNHQDYIALDGGYMEVREDQVIVLADAAEFVSKMDCEELKRIKTDVEARLASLTEDSAELFQTAAELARVTNRLVIAEKRQT
jgi:F-type H+-transporting ATPase subunit epsilon